MSATAEMFPETKLARRRPRILMHVIDAGIEMGAHSMIPLRSASNPAIAAIYSQPRRNPFLLCFGFFVARIKRNKTRLPLFRSNGRRD